MADTRWTLRPLCTADLPALLAVQRACYGDGLIESEAVYARRLASPAHRSLALVDGREGAAGALVAYLAAYRSTLGRVTPLHGDFGGAPESTHDTLYLHDMAVLPAFHGLGLAQRLLAAAWQGARADGLRRAALVSVQGAQAYWTRQGFAVHALAHAAQRQRLAGYGDGAVYMVREGSG